MSNALVPQNIDDVQRFAKMFVASGLFKDVTDVAKACVKIQAGAELGVPPYAAIRGVHIIEGQPELGVHLMSSRVKASGKYDYQIIEHDDDHCVIEFYDLARNRAVLGRSSFSIADARRAQLPFKTKMGKDTQWVKNPKNMTFARAMSNGIKWYCPDVFNGPVYAEGEIREALPAESEVLSSEPPVKAPSVPVAPAGAEEPEPAPIPGPDVPATSSNPGGSGDVPPSAQPAKPESPDLMADIDDAINGVFPPWATDPIGLGNYADYMWDAAVLDSDAGRAVASYFHRSLGQLKRKKREAGEDEENMHLWPDDAKRMQCMLILREWIKGAKQREAAESFEGESFPKLAGAAHDFADILLKKAADGEAIG